MQQTQQQQQMWQQQQHIDSNSNNNLAHSSNNLNTTPNFFERVTSLLYLLCYRKKNWLNKLVNHSLLVNVIKILKVR
jgi:hypothetical protein